MSRLSDLGVAKRPGLIVLSGALLLAALATLTLVRQDTLANQSHTINGRPDRAAGERTRTAPPADRG